MKTKDHIHARVEPDYDVSFVPYCSVCHKTLGEPPDGLD